MPFDRKRYFDAVRESLFAGVMSEAQVDGQEAILSVWEKYVGDAGDKRWLAYMLATTYHETSQEMQPIEEYGLGEGYEYGKQDPETGQTYYGRGFVQLTHRENYARADDELDLEDEASCEWDADNALNPWIAARIMYQGMYEGWFRGDKLEDYFNDVDDDPFGARDIINGDQDVVPAWSDCVSIGDLVKDYHEKFLEALNASRVEG